MRNHRGIFYFTAAAALVVGLVFFGSFFPGTSVFAEEADDYGPAGTVIAEGNLGYNEEVTETFINTIDVNHTNYHYNTMVYDEDDFNDNVIFQIISNGDGSLTLSITGSGKMGDIAMLTYDYIYSNIGEDFVNISNVYIGEGITNLGAFVLTDIPDKTHPGGTLVVPDSVTEIGASAFERSNFDTIIIGDGCKTIGDVAFVGCEGDIVLGKNVSSLGLYCFSECTSKVYCLGDKFEQVDKTAFLSYKTVGTWYYSCLYPEFDAAGVLSGVSTEMAHFDVDTVYLNTVYVDEDEDGKEKFDSSSAFEWVTITEPTCTASGTEKYTCSYCGTTPTQNYTRSVAATGHDYTPVVTAPTCTEAGYTTYTCADCGDTYVDDHVDATGHTWKEELTRETKTVYEEDGTTTKYVIIKFTCEDCGAAYYDYIKEGNAAEEDHTHTWGEGTVLTAPTCTSSGMEEYTCDCGAVAYVYIDMTAHTYTEEVTTAPACTEAGYTTHVCSVCGDSYTDAHVEALGHSYGDGVIEVEGSCTLPTETVYTCTVCGDKFYDATDAPGHEFSLVETIFGGCLAKGENIYKCSVCDTTYVEYTAAPGHQWVHVAAKDATDTEDGNIEYWYCSVCGEYFTSSAGEHADEVSYEETIVPATDGEDIEDSNGDAGDSDTDSTSVSPETGGAGAAAVLALIVAALAAATMGIAGYRRRYT